MDEKNKLLIKFTAPMGRDKIRPTKEQIMAIPDRARRRAAIAENMKLFEGGKHHG